MTAAVTPCPSTRADLTKLPLHELLIVINRALLRNGFPAISYATIAKQFTCSKSTVGAVINGTYQATTAAGIRSQIRGYIMHTATDLGIIAAKPALPATTAATVPAKSRRAPRRLVRVHPTGYLRYRSVYYYAGQIYAGVLVTAAPIRGDRGALRIAWGRHDRVVRPIDPEGNQLGFNPSEARHA